MRAGVAFIVCLSISLVGAASTFAAGKSNVAALQVALHARGTYHGTVDGVLGPRTRTAVERFQRRSGLAVDGVVGPRTRAALGRLGRPRLGSRPLREGRTGWDVAALQFALAWHGFPSGPFDGAFGPRTHAAVRRFQRYSGLAVDGVAGPDTLTALRRALATCPLALSDPVEAPLSSPFGPRGDRFHEGVDLAASYGTVVRAAAGGVVVVAGWNDGYGRLVGVSHGRRVTTYYAHLSRISVVPGARVPAGGVLGRVGSSGESTGPHLHFEVHLRGAAVDPLPALR